MFWESMNVSPGNGIVRSIETIVPDQPLRAGKYK